MFKKAFFFWLIASSAFTSLGANTTAPISVDVNKLRLSKTMQASKPLSVQQRRTTNGDIYLANLNGIIERHVQAQASVPHLVGLIELYRYRYGIIGHAKDLNLAKKALAQATAINKADPAVILLQADFASTEHEFDIAEKYLSQLTNDSLSEQQKKQLSDLQTEINASVGALIEAELVARAKQSPSLTSYAALANLRVQQGRFAVAEILFKKAQQYYHDVNPLPLAWLHTQHGIMYLRMQHHELAQRYFAAAHERFPQYYLATEHLAETELLLGNKHKALALYQQVSEQTQNPQFYLGLAEAQQQLDNNEGAQQAQALARLGFEQWLQDENWAQLQHSAEYFYETDKKGLSALLVQQNLDSRRNVDSLLLASKLSSGKQACAFWQEAVATQMRPPEMLLMAEQAPCVIESL